MRKVYPMPDLPSRPLPGVRVVAGSDPDVRWVLATREPESGRAPRGLPEEVRAGATVGAGGRVLLEVELDPAPPRSGWAGAVDTGLGYRRAGAALARHLRERSEEHTSELQSRFDLV